MENRNIYKMDDVLIIASYVMLIPTAFFAWPWLKTFQDAGDIQHFLQSAQVILGSRLNMAIMYAAGCLAAQFVGRIVRFKEKQSLKILDAMRYSGKTTVDQLAVSVGMSSSRVRSLVKKLSRIPSLNLTLDGDRVYQGARKNPYQRPDYRAGEAPKAARSPASGIEPGRTEMLEKPGASELPISGRGSSTETDAKAKGMPRELEAIMKDRSLGVLEKIKKLQEYGKTHPEYTQEDLKSLTMKSRGQTPTAAKKGSGEGGEQKKFNIILFVILFLTPLWPIAIIYAITFAVKQKKNLTSS